MTFEPEFFRGEVRSGFYVQPLMKRVWAAQIEVLDEIDKICTRHNIKYIAQWGTLLGAIRHKGFIPWDDDMDLSMLRDDYERFIYYAKRELPEGWKLYDHNDERFNTLLVRVVNSNCILLDRDFLEKFHGCPFFVGVDIFPMDRVPEDEEEQEALFYMLGILDKIGREWKEQEASPQGIESVAQKVEDLTGQRLDRTRSIRKQILHLADRTSAMYWDQDTEYVAMLYKLPDYPERKIPISWFDKIIRVPFENTTVPVIENYDYMLRKYLGEDYMEPRVWASHGYPFFMPQINDLKDFFNEENVELPEFYNIFARKDGKPLISVVVSCYNVEKQIDRCLKSLMCQTIAVTSLEIICIDDASDDGTINKLREWQRMLGGNILVVIPCESHGKRGTARNIGIERATADYVAFVNGDDWVEIDYFEKLYRITQIDDFDVAACAVERDFSEELTYFECSRATEKESRCLLIDTPEKRKTFINVFLCGDSVLGKAFKRELLIDNQIYFPEQVTYEDAYFEALLHLYVNKVYLHEEKLYHDYVNDSSDVLAPGMEVYTDLLTEESMKWQAWEERGLLEEYREELEYQFLRACYLRFIKLLAAGDEQQSYSLFMLAKELTLSCVPDYSKNKYLATGFTEFQKILLETLTTPVQQEEFLQIIDMVKMYGV